MQVEGIVNKVSKDSSLEKINDAVLRQGCFGRLLDFGDLEILTASDTTVDDFRMLNDAAELQEDDAQREVRPRTRGRVADAEPAAARPDAAAAVASPTASRDGGVADGGSAAGPAAAPALHRAARRAPP